MAKVVGIAGSSRVGGNTEIAVNTVLEELAKKKIDTEIISLANRQIANCRGCDYCRRKKDCIVEDDFQPIFKKLAEADGIILASPVYSFGPTPQMLAFKTRASRIAHAKGEAREFETSSEFTRTYPHPSLLVRKVGATIVPARRSGASLTISVLNSFFLTNEMFLVGAAYLNVALGYDKGDVLKDVEGIKNLRVLGENMAWILEKLS